MSEMEIINRIIEGNPPLKTTLFLKDLASRHARFGSFTENQRAMLLRIASDRGIKIAETGAPNVVPLVAPTLYKGETVSRVPVPLGNREISGTCGDCRNGLIPALQNESKNLYSFRCECSVGMMRPEQFPFWRHFHGREFTIDKP